MPDAKLRHAIALEAARLMYDRTETEYYTAKRKAAKRLCRGGVKPRDLPSNAEIRDQVQLFTRLHEGERRTENLKEMRLEALVMMRHLRAFKPRLIGSVMTGHIRAGSDIDIHLFSDSAGLITDVLEQEGYAFDLERKQVVKHNVARVFTHIHVADRFNYELTVYAENQAHYVFKSSITGKAIERASIRELEEFLAKEYPDFDLEDDLQADRPAVDASVAPFPIFHSLLAPLENVKQSARHHPEGDALYHSLQVFELARAQRPWDEEFLLAALLHDVGKGIDPSNHVAAALSALDGLITPRTQFFIEHHMDALKYKDGTLGARLKKKLAQSEDFDDLMLLRELDSAGRVSGAVVGTLEEALNYLQELDRENR
ncbi:MAG: tRNA adenylyltransferase [Gemmataceae bacterium]|nr:tRNA adenylyltransferase [Gemmataceae bacterium]MCI0740346.1 tRNA adenylyltransferase [Gemmataceae bacterium]